MQVTENLLSNALKYGAAEAPIKVSLEADGSGLALAVSNEGEGISPEAQAQLFHRFQRVGERAQKIAGIGLGLQITHGLIEAHGGHISVHSERHGTTTFRCVLPGRAQPQVAALAADD
jgi:signal transduction histidine kinase